MATVEDKCPKGTEDCRFGPCFHGGGSPCETADEFRERLRLREIATEERLAWDHYAAAAFVAVFAEKPEDPAPVERATRLADALLKERRKRFPAK